MHQGLHRTPPTHDRLKFGSRDIHMPSSMSNLANAQTHPLQKLCPSWQSREGPGAPESPPQAPTVRGPSGPLGPPGTTHRASSVQTLPSWETHFQEEPKSLKSQP